MPYKQRVLGSNPCAPTKKGLQVACNPFFIYATKDTTLKGTKIKTDQDQNLWRKSN